MSFSPADIIVPVIAVHPDGSVQQFLGTGAFIGNPPLLLTADHVIRDWQGPFAITLVTQLNCLFAAEIVKRDPKHDLALLKVNGYEPSNVLSLAEDQSQQLNQIMATFEYGTTTVAGKQINISPSTRLGNITRVLNMTDRFGPAGDDVLEMSFPALRGASDAPVVSNDGQFKLHGVVIANASYHLLPSQIETVLDEKNEILEETKFMLPQAIAVNVKHVRSLLNSVQPPPNMGGSDG